MRAIACILLLCALFACQQPAERKRTEVKSHPSLTLWDGYDFSDTTLIYQPDITERRFSTFLALLHRTPAEEQSMAVHQLMAKVRRGSPQMFAHFCQLAEKYLADPNSPFRNEELYIPFLTFIVECEGVESSTQSRAQFELQMALKNRRGTIAEDFSFITSNKQQKSLHALNYEYILLFFYNPECAECQQLKADILATPLLTQQQQAGLLQILALYPDEDIELWERHLADNPREWITARYASHEDSKAFYLAATPTLYLLARDKRVLLKDTSLEQIEDNLRSL